MNNRITLGSLFDGIALGLNRTVGGRGRNK